MIFLTEEDVRQRCELGQGGEFRLQAGERLTPAATELLRSRNCRVILPGQCTVEAAPVEEAKPAAPAAEAAPAAPAAEQASFPDGPTLTPIRSSPSPTRAYSCAASWIPHFQHGAGADRV